MTQQINNQTFIGTNQYLELSSQGKVIHLELNKPHHKIGRDPTQVDLLVPEDWQNVAP